MVTRSLAFEMISAVEVFPSGTCPLLLPPLVAGEDVLAVAVDLALGLALADGEADAPLSGGRAISLGP